MRKVLVSLILCFGFITIYAQQFNTADILTPGAISGGINPVYFDKGGTQIGIFLHGGYGLTRKTDFSFRYGVIEGVDYFGSDLEWLVKNTQRYSLSVITGMHKQEFFGLDGGLVASFPIRENIHFFSGIDIDFNFERETQHYTWIPIGIEAFWKNDLSFIIEIDVPMSEWAWNIFGGGFIKYL